MDASILLPRIIGGFGLTDRTQAALFAVRHGLAGDDPEAPPGR